MQGLRDRTKDFALRVIRMHGSLPRTPAAQVMGNQVLRSATSVAANSREASRARSENEFIAKLGTVEQELDETLLWFELLIESGIVPGPKLDPLHREGEELLKIVVTAIKRTKVHKRQPAKKPDDA
jgi:four helix bundle protein